MADHRSRKSLYSFRAVALLAVSAATAQVAGGATGIDASGQYQQEVQACRSGQTQQNLETCLQEARNAQADRQRGVLRRANPDYEANATARCDVLEGEYKAACQARVMGYGATTGNVAGGGILREVETVVLPQGATSVTIEPLTSDPVVLVPAAQ